MQNINIWDHNIRFGGNDFVKDLDPEMFLWMVEHRSAKSKTWNYYDTIKENDLFSLQKLLVWSNLRPGNKEKARTHFWEEKDEQHVQAIIENFKRYNLKDALTIIWGYWHVNWWNNNVIQESEKFYTTKNLWWKATKKELLYGIMLLRSMQETKDILKELERKDRKSGGLTKRYDQYWYDKLQTTLWTFADQFWDNNRDRLLSLITKEDIVKKFLDGLSQPTIQGAIKPLQEIYKIKPEGEEFLKIMFHHVLTDEQLALFDLNDDLIDFRDETFKEAAIREIKEESGWIWEPWDTLWRTAEVKRIRSRQKELHRKVFAIKIRNAYKVTVQWKPDTNLKKESLSELDQENEIVDYRSSLWNLIQAIKYTAIKLGIACNTHHLSSQVFWDPNNLASNMNSQLANNIHLLNWFLYDYKKWSINLRELQQSITAQKLLNTFWLM